MQFMLPIRSGQLRMNIQGFLLLLFYFSTSSGQLIGSRGVFTPKEGFEYRDPETVQASENVADFAKEFQEIDDDIAERRSHSNSFQSRGHEVSPKFQTAILDNIQGRPLVDNEIFDFLESRFLEPPQDLQFNKFLDEVEIERATSPVRLLPGEGLPPTPRPPPRAPNRLTNLVTGSEESVRSQNSRFPTVFGPPATDNLLAERPRTNQLLDTNVLVNSQSNVGFTNLASPAPQSVDVNSPHVIRPFVNFNSGPRFVPERDSVPLSGPGLGVGPSPPLSRPNTGLGRAPLPQPASSARNQGFLQPAVNQGIVQHSSSHGLGSTFQFNQPFVSSLNPSGSNLSPGLSQEHLQHLTNNAPLPPIPLLDVGASGHSSFGTQLATPPLETYGAAIAPVLGVASFQTGGSSHSLSTGPHHTLSIQHLH